MSNSLKPAIRFKEFTNDWEQQKFKDIYIKAMSGGTPNTGKIDYYNGNIPFLSIADMTKQQKYIENTTKQISNLGLKNSSCWLVPPNSLLLSIYASLGKTAINKANMATSQAILGIILKNANETQFYYYLLTKMENKKYWYKYISLGTQPNLSLSTVEESLIFSAELEEKIKIGNTFESLDTLITLHQRKLEKLKNIKNMLLEKMFAEEKTLKPAVRFKEFTNTWEQRRLGEIVKVFTGEFVHRNIQRSNFYYPVYNGGTTNTGFYYKNNQTKDKIVMSSRGASAGYVNFVTINFWAGNSVFSIDIPMENDKKFVFYNLKNKYRIISSLIKTSGIPAILLGDVLSIEIQKPDLHEQVKVSSIFTLIDTSITLHQRKLEKLKNIKNMLLEKMFADEKALKPAIRFKEFTNAWEQRTIGDLLTTLSCREYIREPEPGGKYEIIQQGDNPILGFCSGSAFSDYQNVIIFGDHTISLFLPKRPFFIATDGIKFLKPKNDIDRDFLYFILKRYKPESNGYRRHWSILTNKNCFNTLNPTEQLKISNTFSFIESLITLHQRKLEKLKNIKNMLLEKMFADKKTLKPAIRFKEFTNDWEERRLGEVVKITMGHSPDGSTYSNKPSEYILVQGNADLRDGWVFPRIWTTQETKKAFEGELIMSVRAPAGAIGKTLYDVVIGRGVAAIKGNEFIYQLLSNKYNNGYWNNMSSGSTFSSLNSGDIKCASFHFPLEIEQNKIGYLFSSLDSLISLHKRKLEKLKNIKNMLLEKMFI